MVIGIEKVDVFVNFLELKKSTILKKYGHIETLNVGIVIAGFFLAMDHLMQNVLNLVKE